MTAMDLLPTFAKLAGAEIPADRVIDGKDIWPVVTDQGDSPHEAFFYFRDNQLKAVRSGKWKLHLTTRQEKNGRKPKTNSKASPALFDLDADISEKNNVLDEHRDVEQRLRAYVAAFEKDLEQNSRPAAFVENPKPLGKPADGSN